MVCGASGNSNKNHAPEHLGRVLVIGLGKSGMAVVRYVAALVGTRVESVFVAAGARTSAAEAFASEYACDQVRFAFECETFDQQFDVCIASPGIPQTCAFYRNAQAASTEIISEAEFAWREADANARWICITGTNGKTTTTALCAHILAQAGFKAAAVGNIGDVCLEAVAAGNTDVYVAELSSYQLASTRLFAPQVSVILNITPDHLDWHGGFEAYRAAKFLALENLSRQENALAVLNATDDEVRAKVRELKAQTREARGFDYIPLGTAAGLHESMIDRCGASAAAFIDAANNDMLTVEYQGARYELCQASDLHIQGNHYLCDALAAAVCALHMGATPAQVAKGLKSFRPLEHRMEPCGSIAGVTCINDSKATNVDSAEKALGSFAPGSVIVLLGGYDKGTDLSSLVAAALRTARAVVCFGEAGERFYQAFYEARQGECPRVLRARHMEDALDVALSYACEGDTILLSPACSSFDEFANFEERGRVFKYLVAQRSADKGA